MRALENRQTSVLHTKPTQHLEPFKSIIAFSGEPLEFARMRRENGFRGQEGQPGFVFRQDVQPVGIDNHGPGVILRSEEHTSELQSRGLISYAVFCLKK